MSIEKNFFGKTQNEQEVYKFTLKNKNDMSVDILNFGAIIQSIKFKKDDKLTDVVLGHNSIEEYELGTGSIGAFVGRYANRIKNAEFEIDGKKYTLSKNNGNNHLHGTYSKQVFDYEILNDKLKLIYISEDGEEGYPGELTINIFYSLSDLNELIIEYIATTSKDTILNFTNHSYFNLNGKGNIFNHKAKFEVLKYTEMNDENIPTGNILDVKGTVYDFLDEKEIGQDILNGKLKNGYDDNLIINKNLNELKQFAKVIGDKTGIVLEVSTTEPAFQFYTAAHLSTTHKEYGKKNELYEPFSAFCIEAQHFPDSPHNDNFPTTLLKKDDKYVQTTIYKFY